MTPRPVQDCASPHLAQLLVPNIEADSGLEPSVIHGVSLAKIQGSH